MRDVTPTVYLLAGPPGSGKSTYARTLEAAGVVLLAPGPEDVGGVEPALVEHMRAGHDVVIDHGLDGAQRDTFKRLVEENGAQWCVINLSAEHTGLVRRLAGADALRR